MSRLEVAREERELFRDAAMGFVVGRFLAPRFGDGANIPEDWAFFAATSRRILRLRRMAASFEAQAFMWRRPCSSLQSA